MQSCRVFFCVSDTPHSLTRLGSVWNGPIDADIFRGYVTIAFYLCLAILCPVSLNLSGIEIPPCTKWACHLNRFHWDCCPLFIQNMFVYPIALLSYFGEVYKVFIA